MPTYRVTDSKTGKTYRLTGDSPPTEAELAQIFGADDVAPAAPADDPGILSRVWDAAKTPVKAALELTGRPGEGLQGFVAGTLKGGISEGLRRGAAAAFEPNIVNSQIEESTSKTLDEQGILSNSPKTRAVVGFAGDVISDPLNLLGGAGFIRRGLQSAGVPKAALGLPIGEAFQNKVVPAVASGLNRVVADVAPALKKDAKLTTIVDPKSGLSAADMKRLAEGKTRAVKESIILDVLTDKNALFKNVPAEDRMLLSFAREYPNSSEAAQVAADPRLSQLMAQAGSKFKDLYTADVAGQFMDATKTLSVSPSIQAKLDALAPKQLTQLEKAIQSGKPLPATSKLEPIAAALTNAAHHTEGADVLEIADLNTLKFQRDPATGLTSPNVSSEMPNYVGHYIPGESKPASVFRQTRPVVSEANKRVTTLKEAVALGANPDMADILIRRSTSSARAAIDKQLITDYVTAFGKATPAQGFVPLKPTTLEMLPPDLAQIVAKSPYLPADVAQDIEKFNVRLNDPEQMEGLFLRGTKLWKTLATSMNVPTFQVNNFLGNVTNMYGSGMSMDQVARELTQATHVINGGGKYKDFTDAAGKVWTHDEVLKAAKTNGVYGHVSGYAGELGEKVQMSDGAKLLTGKWNPLNPDNALYQGAVNVSQRAIEDPAKLGMFVHELKQGAGVDKAVLKVKNVLFDYAELSDKERKIRKFIPFYTWTRKNLPLQIAHLAKNPKSVANQGRLLDLARELAANDELPDVDESKLPQYMQKGNTFPLVGTSSVDGDPVVGSLKTPLMDLNLLSTDLKQTAGQLAGMINPIAKAPIEIARGERFDTGAPTREGYSDATVLARLLGLGAVKPDGTRIQPNLDKYLLEQAPIPLGAFARSMPYAGEKGAMNPIAEIILRGAGLAPQSVTPEWLKKARTRAKADKTIEKKNAKADAAYKKLKEQN